jgi:hypothetical protein
MATRRAGTPGRLGVIPTKLVSRKPKVPVGKKKKKNADIPFETDPKKIKGVPFVKLYANGIAYSSKYVKDVHMTSIKEGAFNKWPGVITTTVTIDDEPPPRHYTQIVVARDFKALRLSKAIFVRCNCLSFLFRSEYALWFNKATNIYYCNGEPASVTNPNNIPLPCKHILRICEQIVKKKL